MKMIILVFGKRHVEISNDIILFLRFFFAVSTFAFLFNIKIPPLWAFLQLIRGKTSLIYQKRKFCKGCRHFLRFTTFHTMSREKEEKDEKSDLYAKENDKVIHMETYPRGVRWNSHYTWTWKRGKNCEVTMYFGIRIKANGNKMIVKFHFKINVHFKAPLKRSDFADNPWWNFQCCYLLRIKILFVFMTFSGVHGLSLKRETRQKNDEKIWRSENNFSSNNRNSFCTVKSRQGRMDTSIF